MFLNDNDANDTINPQSKIQKFHFYKQKENCQVLFCGFSKLFSNFLHSLHKQNTSFHDQVDKEKLNMFLRCQKMELFYKTGRNKIHSIDTTAIERNVRSKIFDHLSKLPQDFTSKPTKKSKKKNIVQKCERAKK